MNIDTDKLQNTSSQDIGIQVLPLSDVMAAEVIGLNLSNPITELAREAIHQAFLSHQLLVFRDQDLTKAQQVTFTENFGTLERHTARNQGSADIPLVHVVSNLDAAGKPSGTVNSTMWHSDKSFRPEPSMATVLHAVTLPPDGGDTCFANMYAAFEALPEAEKTELDGMQVIHSWELSRENRHRVLSKEEIEDAPPMSHPLVRVHPETGRKALFIGMHASHLDGMEMMAGRERLESLERHATQSQFIYRHHWRKGDVLMWDNRCLLHHADPNFDAAQHPRVLHRTCLRGSSTM